MRKIGYLFVLMMLMPMFVIEANAQKVVPAPKARVSPMSASQVMLDNGTYLRIIYGSPRRQDPATQKERTVFGELVPFGQVWRMGANEATMLVTTGDLQLGDKKLPAGVYSLFAIPQKDRWTLIVNSSVGQWGTQYDESKDVFRMDLPVTQSPDVFDAFTISFDEPSGDKKGSNMNIMWEQAKVTVPVRVATN